MPRPATLKSFHLALRNPSPGSALGSASSSKPIMSVSGPAPPPPTLGPSSNVTTLPGLCDQMDASTRVAASERVIEKQHRPRSLRINEI